MRLVDVGPDRCGHRSPRDGMTKEDKVRDQTRCRGWQLCTPAWTDDFECAEEVNGPVLRRLSIDRHVSPPGFRHRRRRCKPLAGVVNRSRDLWRLLRPLSVCLSPSSYLLGSG